MINFTLYMIRPIVLLMNLLILFDIIGIIGFIWTMNREDDQHGAKDVHDTQCDTSCNTPDQNTGQKS